ncbi:MAG: protein kinase [Thermoanaerobaculia bacterium]
MQHQHIGGIFGLEEHDEVRFLVLELVEGETLAQRIAAGPLPVDEALRLADQIAAALEEAHRCGVLHRDLKPANVMVTPRGVAKVLDFGLARSLWADRVDGSDAPTRDLDLTGRGEFLGTLAYMSPEQALGRALDARSDLFSLGTVVYEMLTGRHPFRAEAAGGTLDRLLNADPEPPSTWVHGLPAGADAFLRRLLAKRPEDRYAAATDVRAALTHLDEPPIEHRKSLTIAVLPFANSSADPHDEFLADGMADEILTALAKVRSLRVLSRTSSFAFKGRAGDVRDIARQLGADVVLEGSLRRLDRRLRVATQLIDADDGYQIWADRFDRDLEDVFAVQDEIAESVAGALQIVLSQPEREALQRISTDSLEAYELYLRGRGLLRRFSDEKVAQAQYLLHRAVALDPEYLPAWLSLVEASLWIYQWGLKSRRPGDLEIAVEASERARELAPDRAETLTAIGLVAWLRDDLPRAVRALQRAREIDPRLWEAAFFLARVSMTAGDRESAVRHYLEAAEIQPDDFQSLCLAGSLLEGMGREEQLLEVNRRALAILEAHVRLHPDDARAYYLGCRVHHDLGDVAKGIEWAETAVSLGPNDGGVRYNVACFYASIGRVDDALDLLEANVATGWGFRHWLEQDPDMDPLREHARFRAVLERMRES